MVEDAHTLSTKSEAAMEKEKYPSWTLHADCCYVAPEYQEFDIVVKNAKGNSESHVESAMPCKAQRNCERTTLNNSMSTS